MILLSCNWQNFINAIPCLCWGIIGLIAFYLLLKFCIQPCMKYYHDMKMKEEAHKREQQWAKDKETIANSDESLNKIIEDLERENEKLKKKMDIENSRQEALNNLLDLYKQHLNSIISNTKKQ